MRTNATADGREGGVFGDYVGGSGFPFSDEGVDEAGDVDMDGACLYATRTLAVKAARCFEERLFFIIS